jgi:cysteine desulfurase/selenocysteine lyase
MPVDEEQLYEEHILDHYEDPYHRGSCAHCTHCHEDTNPLCGDRVRLELQIVDGGRLREVFFDGQGCCISQAAASMLVERFDGKTVEEVKQFSAEDMLRLFEAQLTPNRQKCCLLPWRVLQAAIYSPVQTNGVLHRESEGARDQTPQSPDRRPQNAPAPAAAEPATAPAGPHLDPTKLRPDFPVLARVVHDGLPLVYLDNAATTQRPRQVIQAIVDAYESHYSNVHRGIHTLAEECTALYEGAREKVRQFIHADQREEIVFTSGATAAINLVARAWGDANVREGDEILLTEMEHHSNLVPWYQLAERTGAVVRHVPLSDDGRLELESLDRLLTGRTKIVAVTAVSNVLGTINPLEPVIRRAQEAGALVLVDGAQRIPHLKTDVLALNCDFLAFSGHKMLGPSGVGVLYGKRELLEAMPPFLGGGSMLREATLEGFLPAGLPERFEAGTPPIVPAIGLAAAIDYLNAVGLEAIHAHERRLTQRAHERLEAIGGVRILGPEPRLKGGIVSFTLQTDSGKEIHAHDVAQMLDRYGVAVRPGHHCAMPLHKRYGLAATARASFYFYNTLEEVDRFAAAVEKTKEFFSR